VAAPPYLGFGHKVVHRSVRAGEHGQLSVTGRTSPAKAVVVAKPVFAYIASLPRPQCCIAEVVDALVAKTLPGLQRSVKWGMDYYAVGVEFCLSCGGFADRVNLIFNNDPVSEPR